MSLESPLLTRLGGTYHGIVPVVAAVLLAFWATSMLWEPLRGVQTYRDVVTGQAAWHNADKSRDFRALYLFIGLSGVFSIGIGGLLSSLSRDDASGELRRAANHLLLLAMLPLFWRLGLSMSQPDAPLWVRPAAVGVAVALAALWILLRHRQTLTGRDVLELAGAALLAAAFGVFAALGLMTIAGRIAPHLDIVLSARWATTAGYAGGAAGALLGLAVMQTSSSIEPLRRRMMTLLLLLQAPLVLLIFVIIPPAAVHRQEIVTVERPLLWIVLAVLAALALWRLWRRYRAMAQAYEAQPWSLRGALAPAVLVSLVVFMLTPVPPAVPPPSPDHFHQGEQMLPWQQLVHFGKVPYVDFIPIHGIMPLMRGLMNVVFLEGTAATFGHTHILMIALAVAVTYLAAAALIGPLAALILCFGTVIIDRFYLFAPMLFVLAMPRLTAQPVKWLVAWAIFGVVGVLYNVAVGLAVMLGTLPAALYLSWRLIHLDRRRLFQLLAAAAAVVLALVLIPLLRGMAGGFVEFVLENQMTNTETNGIPWELGWGRRPEGLAISATQFNFELARFLWIGVLIVAAAVLWREIAQPAARRRRDVVWLCVLAIPAMLLVSQWSVARLDAGEFSRTGHMSLMTVVQVLPVLALLVCPPRLIAPASAGLVLLFGLITPVSRMAISIMPVELTARTVRVQHVPDHGQLIDGGQIGLPNLGRVPGTPVVEEIVEVREALAEVLRPGETFLDMTNQQALYYYLGLPSPALYSSTYVASNTRMQRRMLRQLRAEPPPVVLAAPAVIYDGGLPSLRSYLLYREYALTYVPQRLGEYVALVDPQRVDVPSIDREDRLELLDEAFRPHHIFGLAAAWGGSWRTLERHFELVAEVPPRRIIHTHHLRTDEGWLIIEGRDPYVVFDLSHLELSGREADFLLFELKTDGPKRAVAGAVAIRWEGEDAALTQPLLMTAVRGRLLVPIGASPRWLLCERLHSIRFDLEHFAPAVGRFEITRLRLLKLSDTMD